MMSEGNDFPEMFAEPYRPGLHYSWWSRVLELVVEPGARTGVPRRPRTPLAVRVPPRPGAALAARRSWSGEPRAADGKVRPPPRSTPAAVREAEPLRRFIAATLGAAYLLLLFDLTLRRFPQPGAVPNLVPLTTVAAFLRLGGWPMVVNVLGNLAAFVPVGPLVLILRGGQPSARAVAAAGLGLSGLIEALQYLSGRRVADVDDVLLNALGALLGYAAYRAWRRVARLVPAAGLGG